MSERYEIKGKIARGGIGAIYRAHDTVMGREVAIKRLLPLEQTHLNEAADESLQREAAALARFQHPNIVTIFAFDQDAEGPYVVMELVDGETLKDTVGRAALPVDDFIELTLQMLDPLIAARDLNLLHRDIKPSNIMISWLATGKFQIKMLDFGLAKFSQAPSTQTLDQTGSFLGSIDYLAPEQLELEPLDQRTDLYSLGCVLYFCLTQSPPFEGDNAAKTMRNHLSHQVTPLHEIRPDLPRPIADWVMRLISRYPNQRPLDARAALEDLQAARKGETPWADGGKSPVDADAPVPVAILLDEPVAQPTRRAATAPQLVTGTGQGRSRTQPQLLVPAGSSGPVRQRKSETGPRRKSATGPNSGIRRPASSTDSGIKGVNPKMIGLAIASALLLIALLVVLSKNSKAPETGAAPARPTTAPADTGTKPPAATSPASSPMPALKNTPAAATSAPVPAVVEGLVTHFAASDAVHGPDFQTPAEVGDRVTWWGNLAAGAAADHLLAVEARHQDRGPLLAVATPSKHPELARGFPVLDFEASTRLSARGRKEIERRLSGAAMTSVIVMRPASERGGVLRFEADEIGGVMNWDLTPDGHQWRMHKGSLRPTMTAKIGALRDRFLVITHVWDGEKVEQLSYLSFPGGLHVLAAAGDAPHRDTPVHRYSIGGIAAAGTPTFEGQVAEWLIYDRALPDDEREKVAGQLADRYLRDRPVTIDFISPSRTGQIPSPRNPEANATTRAPAPPITEALVGHYAASDFAFGNDLRHGAVPGQRVMAWANLAPGSSADHLLAYPEGRPAAAPILREMGENDGSGFNGSHRVLKFSFGETLVATGSTQIASRLGDRGFSAFLVMNTESEVAPVLRFKTEALDPAAGISVSAQGFSGYLREGTEWKSAGVASLRGLFSIVSLVWDPETGTHQLHARTADGKVVASKPVTTGLKTLPLNGYKLGHIPGGRGDTKLYSGGIAEFILYGKPLVERDRKEVEEHLYQRYFAK